MSGPRYSITPPAAWEDERLTPLQMRILGCLGSHTAADGWCIVNQKKLAERLNVARGSICRAMSGLCDLGYVTKREQRRDDGGRTISAYRVIIDREETPLSPSEVTGGYHSCGYNNNDLGKERPSVSNETGKPDSDEPGDLSPQKQFWDESTDLIAECEGEVTANHRKQIGKWVKQSKADYAVLLKLLAAVRATGTRDPISYLHKAVNENWPPPKPAPKPSTIDPERWKLNIEVAKKMRQWSERWGPPPGQKGCHVPPELITPDVLALFKPEDALA